MLSIRNALEVLEKYNFIPKNSDTNQYIINIREIQDNSTIIVLK